MNEPDEGTKAPPVKKFRLGSATAAIWANTSDAGNEYYTITVYRSYMDSDRKWIRTGNFFNEDLLNLAHVIMQASNWINSRPPR